ncbi:type IV secretion system protein VirJ [Novosphingobium flavum]|uniref:Type IV secretion system protein VirJ n=1 Tax=Novosphingobium flavum TaxID=1778672 RepID=A0A7X1FUX8_9SPHN|nr:AcvB/VirJ family lysyl-phosphatidylglycerol hydrolase [Novosphingobium flavum]MBC2666817.1 type IV secretion system protein VirJ [Novosphingobium flavum]
MGRPEGTPSRAARVGVWAVLIVAAGLLVTFALGGYFDREPYALVAAPQQRAAPPLAVVYWSGDMGMRVGIGEGLVDRIAARGVPVLTVSSPVLFASQRSRAFVEAEVARSIREALVRTGARQVSVIGNSFGADMVGIGIAALPADLRARIASVVLVVPGTSAYFQANPLGFAYLGEGAASPLATVPSLRGLPVTCIYATGEDDSLCRAPVAASARRVAIDDWHMMLFSREQLGRALVDAVFQPPGPMA